MQEKIRRRIILYLWLGFLLMMLVAACGTEPTPTAESAEAIEIVATEAVEEPTQTAESAEAIEVVATEAVEEPTQTAESAEARVDDSTENAEAVETTDNAQALEQPSCELVQSGPGVEGTVGLAVEVVVEGLEVPWGLAFLPSGDMLVTERPGRLRLVRDGELIAEPILEIDVSQPPPPGGIERFGSEGGLLGVLLHPNFAANRQFYLFYNVQKNNGQEVSRIDRYVLADDAASAEFERVIIDDLPAALHHQGGRMHIGPDGFLYVGVGAYDPPQAQNPDSLAGKLLRMGLDGQLPADNPDPESYIYISGIRNTQGYDWIDDEHIIMVDHGPSGFELNRPDLRGFDEVSIATAGDNMGWPEIWGCDEQEGLITPMLVWDDPAPPTGAIYYRGDVIPEWTNSFLLTTVGFDAGGSGRHLHRVVLDPDNPYIMRSHEVYLHDEFGRLRTIVADADGVLYMMTSNCDKRGVCPPERDVILRLAPSP